MIYHISLSPLAIVSGPHAIQSDYVRKLTRCGTPDVFDAAELAAFGLVPEVRPPLGEYQSYGDPIVTAEAVTFPVVDWTPEQIFNAQLVSARERWAANAAARARTEALATATNPSADVDARLRAVTKLTGA
jgi:hypothetical protein